MVSVASIWSYFVKSYAGNGSTRIGIMPTGWPLPTGKPKNLETSTAGQRLRWNLSKQCQTQKMTYVSVRHGWRQKRKVAQRRTSASRVSRITSKNQQRRSGRGEWDISAISAISSTTTLRIARRIQPINRGVVGMVLLPSMMLLLMNMPNWKPNWKPSFQANHEPQAHACHESHGPTQVSWIPDESHKGSHKGSHKKNPTKTIGRRDPTSKGSHKHTGCNWHRSAIGRNLRSSHNFIFISEPNVLIWLC